MDTTLVGGAGNDTFNATHLTVTAGDSLNGGAGAADKLQITTTAAASVGTGVQTAGIENISTTATIGALSVDASLFDGVTSVTNTGSTAGVTFTGLNAIPTVNVIAASTDTSVGVANAATSGAADAATINVNGAATTANSTLTLNGVETLNVVSAGSATGGSSSTLTVASDTLTTLNVTGSATAKLAANLVGATATVTGTVTSDSGAHDVNVTGTVAADKVSISMGAGNDTVRIAAIGATHTIAGGDGTDTLVSSASITTTTGANISGFEAVEISGGASVALPTAGNTVSTLTIRDAAGGTLTGLASAGTVNLTTGGNATVSNTAWTTGTADSLTVNVGTSTTNAALAATTTVTATGIETAVINNLALSNNADARSVGVSGANLTKMTVNGNGAVTVLGGGAALTEIDASAVVGAVTFSATTAAAGAKLTGGQSADAITGGTGADTLIGGAGNDTITGGVGIDRLTGDAGADRFVYAANAAGAVVSSLAAPDVITDFTSGTDKIQIAQTLTAFLGNYANLSQAQAAAAADGRGNLAYFVTGENTLYVVAATTGVAASTDTVITLAGVTSIAAADLLLGAQGTGNSVSLAAATVPVVNTTSSNAAGSTLTTALDDTITSAASTALVGTGAAIDGGVGRDTLNSTLATAGLLTSLTTAGANEVAVSNVEVLNFTLTTGGNLNLGANTPATWTNLTVNATDLNAGLTLTTNAAGQTVTVNNTTLGGQGSTITVGNFSNQTVTTGTPADTVTVNGGAASTSISVNTGAGNDGITVGAATALSGVGNVLNGGTGTDTLTFYALAAKEDVNLATLVTNGTLVGIEAVNFVDADNSAHTITAGTGIVSYTVNPSASALEIFNINATAAQANAITTITNAGSATGVLNLVISSAGTVSIAGDVTSGLDNINWGDLAVTLTLNDNAVVINQTGGSAAQSITFGGAAVVQTANIASTGTVAFNLTPALGVLLTAGNTDDITPVAAAGATVSLNFVGEAGTTIDINDGDLALANANLDVINVGGVVGAQSFTYGTGAAATSTRITIPVNAVETGTTQYSYSFIMDNAGTQDQTFSITGFDVGAIASGGDVIILSNAAGSVTARNVATTGASLGVAATAPVAAELLILGAASMQVAGALTSTGDAGPVEAAILAAGINVAANTAETHFYVAVDNGTDTGIYRVRTVDSADADATINLASEITDVQLVAVLTGVSDASSLTPPNFG